MQTEGASGRFKGVFDCVKTTVTKEGVRGLYKGSSCIIYFHDISSHHKQIVYRCCAAA